MIEALTVQVDHTESADNAENTVNVIMLYKYII